VAATVRAPHRSGVGAKEQAVKVVVTGGAGFIGANVVRALLATPEVGAVAVIDDLSSGRRENLADVEVARLHVGSILDVDLLDEAVDGAAAIVHLAARPSVPRSITDPLATHHANATGTLQVLEAARRAGNVHTILASSSSVYGANPELPKHEDLRTQPLSPYGVSKLATESYAVAYHHCYDLPVLPLRFFNVYGPLQPAGHAYAAAIPAFVDAALAGRTIPVFGDGLQSRDFTFVGSVAAVISEAVTRTVTSASPVNLAFGSRRTLLDVVAELEQLLGRSLAIEHLPARSGDVRHSQADQRRFTALFPDAEPVPFADGLARTLAWFRSLTPGAVSRSGA
jgi:UDP-glucose 4-epimerase